MINTDTRFFALSTNNGILVPVLESGLEIRIADTELSFLFESSVFYHLIGLVCAKWKSCEKLQRRKGGILLSCT